MSEQRTEGPTKVGLHLAKYENGRTPADGEPDSVIERAYWVDVDGTIITNDARIAELEEVARAQG
jgi:hypothetical protein